MTQTARNVTDAADFTVRFRAAYSTGDARTAMCMTSKVWPVRSAPALFDRRPVALEGSLVDGADARIVDELIEAVARALGAVIAGLRGAQRGRAVLATCSSPFRTRAQFAIEVPRHRLG